MKRTLRSFAAVALLALPVLANAGIVVIGNPAVPVAALDADQVTLIFLGKTRAFPDGTATLPLDLAEGSPLRQQFAERVLGKTEQQLRGYWTRMVFTGKGQPPRSVGSSAEVLRAVASTPGAIGYVDSRDVQPSVKVLYRLD